MTNINFTALLPNDSDDDVHVLQKVLMVLSRYSWFVAVGLGLPGNLLTILVANRAHNRNLPSCIYMTAMAVADSIFLLELTWFYSSFYIGLLDGWLGFRQAEALYQFHMFILNSSSVLSSLFLAEMSLDRLMAVVLPMKASSLFTKTRARGIVLATSLLILLVNIHLFYVMNYYYDQRSGARLVYIAHKSPSLVTFTNAFSITFGSVLPFSVIIGSNIIIIITLKRASRRRRDMLQQKTDSKEQTQMQNLTRMLIFVSVAYVVTTLPYRLYYPILRMPQVTRFYDLRKAYWKLRTAVQLWAVMNLWFFNYSVNFYLYCIGGGKRYRDDTKWVLKWFLPKGA